MLQLLFFGLFCFVSCSQDTFFASFERSVSQAPAPLKTRPNVRKRRNSNSQINLSTARRKDRANKITNPIIPNEAPPEAPPEYREYIITLKHQKKRPLDIEIGIDSSGSMDHHIIGIGEQLSSLFTFIPEYDWQMGFINADHGDHDVVSVDGSGWKKHYTQAKWQDHKDGSFAYGKLMPLEAKPPTHARLKDGSLITKSLLLDQKILTPQTPNYEKIFLYTVSHFPSRICGNPPFCQEGHLEQPLRALKSSMERVNYDNKDLFRPNTDLVVIIATNEDERPGDQGRATSARDVVDTFNTYLKPLGKRLFAFSILIKDKICLQQENEETSASSKIGKMVAKLADITGGFNISICNPNYGEGLKNISKAIKTLVERSVDIEEVFIPDTLQVEFLNSNPVPWRLFNHTLIFEGEFFKDIQIKISYRALSN